MLKIAKIGLYGMFLNYYPFQIMFGRFIPGGTYIFFAMIVLGVFGDAIEKRDGKIGIDQENFFWLLYLLLALLTSIYALSMSYAISALVKYAVRLFLIIAVTYICEKDKSILFAIRLLAVTAILTAFTAFIQMGDIQKRLSLKTDASISVNDFGAIMVYGCFAVIPFFRHFHLKSEFLKTALTVGVSVLLIVELFISGSRKSFYAIIIFYALMLLFVWVKPGGNFRVGKALGIIVIAIAVIFIANRYLLPNMEETSLYQRIWGEDAESAALSDEGRVDLYASGMKEFFSNPITGLGFGNFSVRYGNYTHSTYAEPLACSGIIGLLYLIPYIKMLVDQFKLVLAERKRQVESKWETELLIFYIAFLFVAVGIPYIYKDYPCIILGMLIAHHHIKKDEKIGLIGEEIST